MRRSINGPIGEENRRTASKQGGGIITTDDFARYKVRELAPVECDYRGYHIISSPPPSSGGVLLCEILEHPARLRSEIHGLPQRRRSACARRNHALRLRRPEQPARRPGFSSKTPVAHLIDPAYDASIRARIDPERATPSSQLSAADAGHEGTNTHAILRGGCTRKRRLGHLHIERMVRQRPRRRRNRHRHEQRNGRFHQQARRPQHVRPGPRRRQRHRARQDTTQLHDPPPSSPKTASWSWSSAAPAAPASPPSPWKPSSTSSTTA